MQLMKMVTDEIRVNAWYVENGINIGVCKKGDLALWLASIKAVDGKLIFKVNESELKAWAIDEVRIQKEDK